MQAAAGVSVDLVIVMQSLIIIFIAAPARPSKSDEATAEKKPDARETVLKEQRPQYLWAELGLPQGAAQPFALRWGGQEGYPAAAWGLDVPAWPVDPSTEAPARPVVNVWWTVAVVIISYLMISPFPYPKSKHVLDLPLSGWAGVLLVASLGGFVAGWQAVPFGLLLLYAASGPLFTLMEHPKATLV